MTLSDLMVKASGGNLFPAEKDELRREADRLAAASDLVNSWLVPGSTIPFIRNLKAENIFVPSGEIRLGQGTPGDGFSGVRIGFPAFSYAGEDWNIAGVNNDVLQVGIRASDGKLVAGGQTVFLDESGIVVMDNGGGQAYISFYNVSAQESIAFRISNDNLQVQSVIVGGQITHHLKMTNGDIPYMLWEEDEIQTNRTLLELQPGTQGARLLLVGSGGTGMIDMRTEGSAGGSTFFRMNETSTTPPNPGNGDSFHMYMRNNKFVIEFYDGTTRFYYLDLSSGVATWTYTTTAP